MIQIPKNGFSLFTAPRLFFTMRGQPKSEQVIHLLKKELDGNYECRVFEHPDEVREVFAGGISPNSAVVLFDFGSDRKCFTYLSATRPDDASQIPSWASGSQWAVKVSGKRPEGCAIHLKAVFCKLFGNNMSKGWFPWGSPRKKEKPPVNPNLGEDITNLVIRLNNGPDLARAMADQGHSLELPEGSRISWYRVPPEPVGCDLTRMGPILEAFELFERASNTLTRDNPEVQQLIMAGVDVDDEARRYYLSPPSPCFSVRRPDLHVTGDGVSASENDEMPGGVAELVHIDQVYGINANRWRACFDWLCEKGPVLFLVSSEWSRCYVTEFTWLVQELKAKGYPVHLMTTDHVGELTITTENVTFRGIALGTIWRQFPIFETKEKLIEVVKAAHEGKVRLVPEFGHFGNKSWFSIFRSHAEFFKSELPPATYEILDKILPDSRLVISAQSFPLRFKSGTIRSAEDLATLEPEIRNEFVLKICGANTLAARSYGVLMGHGLSQETWQKWIAERTNMRQPFIVQRRFETSVSTLPVMNTQRRCGEMFDSRLLLRPWIYAGNQLASIAGCAVPSNTLRVHGRVDMAVVPVALSE